MPFYGSIAAPAIPVQTPGRPVALFAADAASAAVESIPCALHRSEHFPMVLSVEIAFSGDPGNFQIDLQTADTDADSNYVSKASVDQTEINSSYVCRIEASNIVAKYFRLKVVSITNAVNVTANSY